ncbi:restriction endonuclease [Oscillibacter sp.]|uniref:restriction endonuclease n=1 Tax=Oscillibacter sp. TaxID=1945593 RepID=UPI003393B938
MIFKHEPQSWIELQDYVKRIFVNCGYQAESPKIIETARSQKLEVDVFAEIDGVPKQTIICECKNWNVNIPQAIVHSFRMQVNDSGANLGLLISKKGFQPSAIEAARFSNVRLLTWSEFEKMYEMTWYKNYFISNLRTLLSPLIEYTEPINSRVFRKADLLSEDKQKRFNELRIQYERPTNLISELCFRANLCTDLKTGFQADKTPLELPLSKNSIFLENRCFPASILNSSSYENVLSELTAFILEAIAAFDDLFGERA